MAFLWWTRCGVSFAFSAGRLLDSGELAEICSDAFTWGFARGVSVFLAVRAAVDFEF